MYLHVLRPLMKPYSGVLDTVFNGLASFGDLLSSSLRPSPSTVPSVSTGGRLLHWILLKRTRRHGIKTPLVRAQGRVLTAPSLPVDEDDKDAQMQNQDQSEYDSSMEEDVFNTTQLLHPHVHDPRQDYTAGPACGLWVLRLIDDRKSSLCCSPLGAAVRDGLCVIPARRS